MTGDKEIRNSDQKNVGKVTSSTKSPLLQQNIALAYVRREVAVGETVYINGAAATVVELPFLKSDNEGISRVRSA